MDRGSYWGVFMVSETLKLEVIEGKYKLSKKTNNTWNFMLLSEAELRQIMKLIEQEVTK